MIPDSSIPRGVILDPSLRAGVVIKNQNGTEVSDGSTADYYKLPPGACELQDLISFRNMNGQDAEMFRAIYRKGRAGHSSALRDARKVLFYAQAEVDRLLRYGEQA